MARSFWDKLVCPKINPMNRVRNNFVVHLSVLVSNPLFMYRLPKISLFFFLITLLSLTGCDFKDVELERVEEIKLNSLKGGNIDGTIFLVLNNPNSFDIKVKSADFDLMTGNEKLGSATLSKSFKSEGNGSKTYPVELSGTLSNARAGGFAGLTGLLTGQKPKVTIKGTLKAGAFLYTKEVPVEIDTELPIRL